MVSKETERVSMCTAKSEDALQLFCKLACNSCFAAFRVEYASVMNMRSPPIHSQSFIHYLSRFV